MPKRGYVYVLQNPAFPQLLKIGRTTRTPDIRARELSAQTAIPGPYRVIYYRHFEDCVAAENAIHEALKRWRVLSRKEFFEIDSSKAIEAIRNYKPVCKRKREKAWLFEIRPLFVVVGLVIVLIGLINTASKSKKGRKTSRSSFEHIENREDGLRIEHLRVEGTSGLSLKKEMKDVPSPTAAAEGSETLSSGLGFDGYYTKYRAEEGGETDKVSRKILPLSRRDSLGKTEVGSAAIGDLNKDRSSAGPEVLELDEKTSQSQNTTGMIGSGNLAGFRDKPKETGRVRAPEEITNFVPGDGEPVSEPQVFFRQTVEVSKAVKKNVQAEIEVAGEANHEPLNDCCYLEQSLSIR